MNFFGHAAIANVRSMARESSSAHRVAPAEELAETCLGAMLPDFVGMLRLGAPVRTSGAVERGIRLHHLTDAAFHELPQFLQLSRAALARLRSAGVANGTARAVAHIGVEILLDEWLAQDASARAAYQAALHCPLDGAVTFPEFDDLRRLEALRRALRERAGDGPASPAEVARRIRRSLESRPRLATDEAGELKICAWVHEARPEISANALELMTALGRELDRRTPALPPPHAQK